MFHPRPTKFMKSTLKLAGTKAKLMRLARGHSFQQTTIVSQMPSRTIVPALRPADIAIEPEASAFAKAKRNMNLHTGKW